MKTLKTLLILVLALSLAGCAGNKGTKVSGGSDVLLQVGKTKITKQSLYEGMLEYDAADIIIKNAFKIIVAAEVEDSDEITKAADAQMKELIEKYTDLETTLSKLGYASEDELYEDVVSSCKVDVLEDRYIEANYSELCTTYNPLKIKVIKFTGDDYLANITAALDKLQAGMSFDNVAKQYSSEEVKEEFYSSLTTSYESSIVNYLKTVTTPGTSEIINSSTSSAAYIVQVTVNNTTQLKEDFSAALKSNDTFTEKVYTSYFKAHNFTIYDKDVYDLVKEKYSAYLPE